MNDPPQTYNLTLNHLVVYFKCKVACPIHEPLKYLPEQVKSEDKIINLEFNRILDFNSSESYMHIAAAGKQNKSKGYFRVLNLNLAY